MNYKIRTVALILLVAGLVTIGQSSEVGAGAEIRARGTFGSAFSTNIAERTFGPDLLIFSRYAVNNYSGSLQGTTVTLQTIARDDRVGSVGEKQSFQVNPGTFWGTLDGALTGSFSFIVHLVADRTVPGVVPSEAKFVVVEGTGMGGLEGICGGGTFTNTGVPTTATAYDYTFRFGKDCKANNEEDDDEDD